MASTSTIDQPSRARPRKTYAKVVVNGGGNRQLSLPKIENSISQILKNKNIEATIQSSHATKDGEKIFVHFGADDNVNLIAENISTDLGLDATGSPPILPKITISHIPQHIEPESIKEELFAGNPCLRHLIDENFEILFSYVHRDYRSVVCKISPNIRDAIVQNDNKVRIGSRRCPAKDRIHVVRCSKCSQYGHTRTSCYEAKETCSFCASHHQSTDCPHKQDSSEHKCINCLTSKKDSANHAAHHQACPIFQHQRQKVILRTNWGNCGIPQF